MNLLSPAPAAAPSGPGTLRGRDGWLRAAVIGGSLLLWLLAPPGWPEPVTGAVRRDRHCHCDGGK